MKRLSLCLALVALMAVASCGKPADDKKAAGADQKAPAAAEKITAEVFFQAVKDNNIAKVKEAIAKDPTLVKATTTDGIGETALAIASFGGKTEIAEFLLQNKADPNAADSYGVVPIIGAARMNRGPVIELLIKNKADVNYKKKTSSETALHYAAEFDSPDAAKVLLANGADKTAKDAEGKTPFDIATEKKNEKVLEVLK